MKAGSWRRRGVIPSNFCIDPTDAGYREFMDRLVGFIREDPAAAGFKPDWVS